MCIRDRLESVQDVSPGPPVPSEQLKLVPTTWPTEYRPPEAGDVILAVGGAGSTV